MPKSLDSIQSRYWMHIVDDTYSSDDNEESQQLRNADHLPFGGSLFGLHEIANLITINEQMWNPVL
jgi:hypothetical protein